MNDNTAILSALSALPLSAFASAYSGRPGCACGCRGKHRYASAHRKEAGEHRGYAVSDDEVSDRSVATVLRNLKAALEAGDCEAGSVGDGEFFAETATRLYIVRVAPSAASAS